MKFNKYSSIENSYRTKFLNQIMIEEKSVGEWCVTEKIHGSNFSVWYNGEDFKCAKRSCFLGNDNNTNFYNYQKIFEENKNKIIEVYKILKFQGLIKEHNKNMAIFGELFGGTYNHPDVSKVVRAAKVQKGINYSPDNHLYSYDIMVGGSYIDYNIACLAFDDTDMLYAKMLMKGSFDECLQHSNDFESVIYKEFDLPRIDDNVCEGVVIKPIKACFLNSGSRVILKNKNDKWEEKSKESKINKKQNDLSPKILDICSTIKSYITENRLKNVISKVGKIEQKDFGMLMKNFQEDIYEDFNKDNINLDTYLEKDELKQVRKLIGKDCASLIRDNFLNIIDANF